jgi:2-oxoglutarate ferredoxin oxidoreductase subunit beta
VKLSTEIYIQAGKFKGTSVVEVLQNCVIYNDKIYSYLTDKDEKENRQIILHHNEPMIFGKDNDRGIICKDNKLKVVNIGENGITKDNLLVHNAKEINPGIHLMLTNMQYPDYPVALGIIRSVDAQTYDYDVNHQMEEIRAKAEIKCVDDLLNSGNTWEL